MYWMYWGPWETRKEQGPKKTSARLRPAPLSNGYWVRSQAPCRAFWVNLDGRTCRLSCRVLPVLMYVDALIRIAIAEPVLCRTRASATSPATITATRCERGSMAYGSRRRPG